MAYELHGRSFLKLLDLTPREIQYLLDLARDLKDATLEADYFKKAKDLYATALKKAKDDPKALAELKKEAQAVGL